MYIDWPTHNVSHSINCSNYYCTSTLIYNVIQYIYWWNLNYIFLESEREANSTAAKALELALLYNFVTELTSLIVVADDNFTLGDGANNNDGALEDSLGFPGGPVLVGSVPAGSPDFAGRKFDHSFISAIIILDWISDIMLS